MSVVVRHPASLSELDRLKSAWPDEYRAGARLAFMDERPIGCDEAGYPRGFHDWPAGRRDAWWAGFNIGRCERIRIEQETAA